MSDLKALAAALIAGNVDGVKELTGEAIARGLHPAVIVNEGLIAGMGEIGLRFMQNEIFVPEVMLAAKAMQAGLGLLRPLLAAHNVEPLATAVLGTVRGDLHDIGKNLVGMMFEGAGFAVIDLGTNVAPQRFVEAVREKRPQFVAMSALLTTTMPAMRETIEALAAAGLRDKVKVLIGGAPVTQDYADKIGAGGYAPDAGAAVELAKRMLAQ